MTWKTRQLPPTLDYLAQDTSQIRLLAKIKCGGATACYHLTPSPCGLPQVSRRDLVLSARQWLGLAQTRE